MATQRCWVFSNHRAGRYGESIWDTSRILRTRRWYFGKDDNNALKVKASDQAIARIYKEGYIAKFRCRTSWTLDSRNSTRGNPVGYVGIDEMETFDPALPQQLILEELSNRNVRNKIIEIGRDDFGRISLAQKIYKRMGGPSYRGDSLFMLEKGLEEAVKHNLAGLGLRLAETKIAQQFRMSIGRSDLICRDKKNNLWILELKREDQPSRAVVGQLLEYMGWVRENLCRSGEKVRGMVICGGADQGLVYACREANLDLKIFRIP